MKILEVNNVSQCSEVNNVSQCSVHKISSNLFSQDLSEENQYSFR